MSIVVDSNIVGNPEEEISVIGQQTINLKCGPSGLYYVLCMGRQSVSQVDLYQNVPAGWKMPRDPANFPNGLI